MMEKAVRIVEYVGNFVLHLPVAVVIDRIAVRIEHILAGAVAIRFVQHAVAVRPRAGMDLFGDTCLPHLRHNNTFSDLELH